ncbi:MAG: type II toxin-antitoxin system VapC family toxin, partial [Acidobacteriota bacterium]
MIAFFDASALVKRYVDEPGSEAVRTRLREELPAAARLTEVEVASAIERRCREGSVAPADRDRAVSALRRDVRSFLMVELTASVVER